MGGIESTKGWFVDRMMARTSEALKARQFEVLLFKKKDDLVREILKNRSMRA
jgi:hypothetical protein